jgi:thymidylate synthase (FAD)
MANINEYSARYSILDKEFYIPDPRNLATQSSTNRQGRESVLPALEASRVLKILREDADRNYQDYMWMLNEGPDDTLIDPSRVGVARELARMNLTLNTYTQWYWKTDLHNLLGFVLLRADAHAQYEIRTYAQEILKIIERWVPLTYEAFIEYRLGAAKLSRSAVGVVRRMLAGQKVSHHSSGLSRREWTELASVLELAGSVSGRSR